MSWFEKILPPRINRSNDGARRVPEGVWVKCPACESVLYKEDLKATLNVCPKCSHHMRIGARARIDALLDPEGRVEIGQHTRPMDPLKFKDSRKYPERVAEAVRSEEHTSELQSLMRISYAVFCLKKKTTTMTFNILKQIMPIETHIIGQTNR